MIRTIISIISFLLLATLFSCSSPEETAKAKTSVDNTDSISVKLELVTNSLEVPIELNVPQGDAHRKFVTDNKGKIWIIKDDSLLPKPFLDLTHRFGIPSEQAPAGAIFSVSFHSQFSTNGKFYVSYCAPTKIRSNTAKLVVAEFTLSNITGDTVNVKSERRIFEMESKNAATNAAQIHFGHDGYLYISIGDDALGDSAYVYRAQDLNSFNGKLLRIDVSKIPYSIPQDNPFVDVKNARPEIWAYGLRKLWRYSFDTATHQFYGGDVGEMGCEEIDIIIKGANYGWPEIEGDSNLKVNTLRDQPSYTGPIHTYTRNTGICIIGGSIYHGTEMPSLSNKYVFADFNGSLFVLEKNGKGGWGRKSLKILNKPTDPFLVCGINSDAKNELYVMGILNSEKGATGALYKIVKAL